MLAPLPAPLPPDHGRGPGGTHAADARRLSGLARAAAAGDRAAATLLVQYTYPPVWRLVSGLVPADGELVEDMVQETYARAFQRLAELPAGQPVLLWLLRTARRLCTAHQPAPHDHPYADDRTYAGDGGCARGGPVDDMGDDGARPDIADDHPPDDSADEVADDGGDDDPVGPGAAGAEAGSRTGGRVQADVSDRIVLQDAVARLDPEKRVAFVLTQILGLSYDEAAQVCGCPIGTIRSRVARARQALIEVLTPPTVTPAARTPA